MHFAVNSVDLQKSSVIIQEYVLYYLSCVNNIVVSDILALSDARLNILRFQCSKGTKATYMYTGYI